jgi:hypothetical protein
VGLYALIGTKQHKAVEPKKLRKKEFEPIKTGNETHANTFYHFSPLLSSRQFGLETRRKDKARKKRTKRVYLSIPLLLLDMVNPNKTRAENNK